jgi:hypothetical protein
MAASSRCLVEPRHPASTRGATLGGHGTALLHDMKQEQRAHDSLSSWSGTSFST